MKKFNVFTHLLFFYLTFFNLFIYSQTHLISLGNNCEPAMRLRDHNLRNEAYPLDWLFTLHFDGLYKMLNENFENFLNPNYLRHNKVDIVNDYYKIRFVHDFPNPIHDNQDLGKDFLPSHLGFVENFLDYLPPIQEKYKKRIDRFYNKLNSTNDSIIFFRTHIKPDDAKKLILFFKNNYPQLNFTLVALYGLEEKNDWENVSINDLPIKPFFMRGWQHENLKGWFEKEDWKFVFQKLNLIK